MVRYTCVLTWFQTSPKLVLLHVWYATKAEEEYVNKSVYIYFPVTDNTWHVRIAHGNTFVQLSEEDTFKMLPPP